MHRGFPMPCSTEYRCFNAGFLHPGDPHDRQDGYQQRVLARAFGMATGEANGKVRKPITDRRPIDLPFPTGKIKESGPLSPKFRPELHFVVVL
ncbi:hypothetical protein LMG29542_07756 [Paraburkholderia humisilvae]|uniref:Uncharacterized protein n=2 Tax=Paraburkholderia humisilvae TaxID=627669 RepID=A0A6J5F680_9BURK|nr:hypothetical protein LMG29542_07756 [Paraburkholderia humisilvae]